jgi:hypothetical protein
MNSQSSRAASYPLFANRQTSRLRAAVGGQRKRGIIPPPLQLARCRSRTKCILQAAGALSPDCSGCTARIGQSAAYSERYVLLPMRETVLRDANVVMRVEQFHGAAVLYRRSAPFRFR